MDTQRTLYEKLADQIEIIKPRFEGKLIETSDDMLKDLVETYPVDFDERMRHVSSLVDLIHMNKEDGTISSKNAKRYASFIWSKLGFRITREYRLLCIKEFFLKGNRDHFDSAEDLGLFEKLKEPYRKDQHNDVDRRIDQFITATMS